MILLHAYEQWGDDFVQRLNGMFDFALWDARRRRLLIGRDRLGVKPLYVQQDGARLAFATEAKAMLDAARRQRRASIATALQSYLQLGYVAAPLSMFEGIRKLPVATLLVRRERAASTSGATGAARRRSTAAPAKREWIERVRDGIERVGAHADGERRADRRLPVRRRRFQRGRRASWPRRTDQPIKTYAIGFEGGAAENLYNELPYARRVAELFGTDHHEIVVKPDVVGAAAAPALAHGRADRRHRLHHHLPGLANSRARTSR